MTDSFMEDLVKYIVGPPCHNITQAAEYFGFSRATIKRYLAMLSDEKSLYYNQFKAMRVKLTLEKELLEARSKAGSISRRKASLTEKQALEARFKNLYQQIPLRELAKEYRCSHMTIYNAIKNLPEKVTRAQDEELYRMSHENSSPSLGR